MSRLNTGAGHAHRNVTHCHDLSRRPHGSSHPLGTARIGAWHGAGEGARLDQRGEPLDALVDQRLVDHAERQPDVLAAAAVGVEERAGHDPDAGLGGAARQRRPRRRRAASATRRSRPRRASSRRPSGIVRSSAASSRSHLRAVERTRALELLVDPAAAHVLLEQPLAERARALVGVLLRRDELRADLRRPDRPAEPHAREERLRRRPGLDDDVRREAPEARQRAAVEAELAVGDVLDDQEAVPPRELDERARAARREASRPPGSGGRGSCRAASAAARRRARPRARRRRARRRRSAPRRARPRSRGTP